MITNRGKSRQVGMPTGWFYIYTVEINSK